MSCFGSMWNCFFLATSGMILWLHQPTWGSRPAKVGPKTFVRKMKLDTEHVCSHAASRSKGTMPCTTAENSFRRRTSPKQSQVASETSQTKNSHTKNFRGVYLFYLFSNTVVKHVCIAYIDIAIPYIFFMLDP